MRGHAAPRFGRLKAIASLGIVVGLGAVSTLAAWTGSATATTTIKAATVALGVGATAVDTVSYTLPFTAANWYPGMSEARPVVVKNSGSIAAPYSISGTIAEVSGGTLGNSLSVVVTAGVVSGTTPTATCTGTALLTKAAGQAFAPAVQPSLAPGASVTLCVQYSLPLTAVTALQGNSTTVALTFTSSVGS